MRAIGLCLALIFGLNAQAQDEIFSFYFSQDAVASLTDVKSVNPADYGKYEPADTEANELRRAAGEYLIVDETGIYLEKNRLLTISREEVRENSKYRVANGWLHGVVENDSVACALDGDTYFFLVPAKNYLYESGRGPGRLARINKQKYAIFSVEDNGYFSCVVVDFTSGQVKMNEINLSTKDPNSIEKIEKKKEIPTETDFTTYILTPTKDEWVSFVFVNCVAEYDAYVKVNE